MTSVKYLEEKEVIQLQSEIYRNLGFDREISDMSQFKTIDPYIEMFDVMCPWLENEIQSIVEMVQDYDDLSQHGEAIQELVKLLGKQVIQLDLSHIKGRLISQGNLGNLVNLLQIIVMVSRQFYQRNKQFKKEEINPNEQYKKANRSILKKVDENQQKKTRSGTNLNGFQKLVYDQIQETREQMQHMKKHDHPDIDPTGFQQIQRIKSQYQRQLKEYVDFKNVLNPENGKIKKLKQENHEKKEKYMKVERKNLRKDRECREKSLQLKQRDDEIHKLQKMRKIIFNLEKERIVEDNRDLDKKRKQQNQETINAFCSIENEYKNRIDMLKEKLVDLKKERDVQTKDQIKYQTKLENDLKKEKYKQISDLKDVWQLERERNQSLDPEQFQYEINQIYKKY